MANFPEEFSEVFSRIQGIKPVGSYGKWTACCPSHEDEKQSLSIAIGRSGGLVMNCNAFNGCTIKTILSAIGLDMKSIAPPHMRERKMATSKIVKVYDYCDLVSGKLLYQCIRYEPKRFNYRRPNPAFKTSEPISDTNPEWIYNLEGVTRVLYRLPELKRELAKNPTRFVFQVEGERDVDALWNLGFLATCNPMGAGKWLPEFTNALTGYNVIVIADNDPEDPKTKRRPGLEHANMVCRELLGKAKTLFLIESMPGVGDKGDFSDWLAMQKNGEVEIKKSIKSICSSAKPYGVVEDPKSPPQQQEKPVAQPSTQTPTKQSTEKTQTPAKSPTEAGAATSPEKQPIDQGNALDLTLTTLDALAIAMSEPHSIAEWYGRVGIAFNTLASYITLDSEKFDPAATRQIAAYLAACVIRGLDKAIPKPPA